MWRSKRSGQRSEKKGKREQKKRKGRTALSQCFEGGNKARGSKQKCCMGFGIHFLVLSVTLVSSHQHNSDSLSFVGNAQRSTLVSTSDTFAAVWESKSHISGCFL